MTKEEMEKICNDFSDEYGELILLKANIAAINKMLIRRGKDKELYNAIMESIENFKKENNTACIEQPHPMLCFAHGGSEACEEVNKKHGFVCPKCEGEK